MRYLLSILSIFFLVQSVNAESQIEIQINDPRGYTTDTEKQIIVRAIDINTGQEIQSLPYSGSSSKIYIPLNDVNSDILQQNMLCFSIEGEFGDETGKIILREPCIVKPSNLAFSLSVRSPDEYGSEFRAKLNGYLGSAKGGVEEYSYVAKEMEIFHLTQRTDAIKIQDVNLYSKYVLYIARKSPLIEDKRFFSLGFLNNPLSSLDHSGYVSSGIFSYIDNLLPSDSSEGIDDKTERAIGDIFLSYQYINPSRFHDPGPLDTVDEFFTELFGLTLALDKLKPNGFSIASVSPLRRYVEKCWSYGLENIFMRDKCLSPFFEHYHQINFDLYPDSERRTMGTKLTQRVSCSDISESEASESYLTMLKAVVNEQVCGGNNYNKCSKHVRSCFADFGEN